MPPETQPEKALRARAFAKVNLGLRVKSRTADGYHPLLSLVQSIDWPDEVELVEADEDSLEVDGADTGSAEDNLLWRAVVAVRGATGWSRPVRARLSKQIPVAAGLGGGSADAAAGLHMAARLAGLAPGELPAMAERLGADVPFCLSGGCAVMEGAGERLSAVVPIPAGYALAVVVPPVELATPSVYAAWDRLDEPEGERIDERHLPPSLREFAPLANDLLPAAIELEPAVADWRAELADIWERPVSMSGSGPSMFAYFIDPGEAIDAVRAIPAGARAAQAAVPVPEGSRVERGTIGAP